MKKAAIIIFTLCLVTFNAIQGEKLATLEELVRPNFISVDNNQVYITEGTGIYIYSSKDFKLKKKFGMRGEGPKEFLPPLHVCPQLDHLVINSRLKVSCYTKDGTLLKEMKKRGFGPENFYPLKKGFVGKETAFGKNELYFTINVYDSDLKQKKEIFRTEAPLKMSGKIEILKGTYKYCTFKNKIFITGKKGFNINVLDHTGKNLFSINRKYDRVKFTKKDEQMFISYFKAFFRRDYEAVKKLLIFPRYFPEIQDFSAVDDKIYVITWKRENEKIELYIFSMEGKLLKRKFVPFVFRRLNQPNPYPFYIKNGKLYQIIENDDEEWEVIRTDIN